MKVILSYERYFNYGKQYQMQFEYENIDEAKQIKTWIKGKKELITKEELTNLPKNKVDNNPTQSNVIKKTSIPKNQLLQIIQELLTLYNAKIIIGNKEINYIDLLNITQVINQLHININLKKGKYFGIKDTYYVTFKYASTEQREEVSYDFNMNLSTLIGDNIENSSYIFPFIIDKFGKLTTENTGIIGGTNIPENTLHFFLQRFINEYDAIINIDDSLLKDDNEVKTINDALSKTNFKSHTRKLKTHF